MSVPISVLLPIYNGGRHVDACLDSVFRQTGPRFDVVAVDDGSRDETAQRLADWQRREKKLRVITFDRNRGIVAALNRGLVACRGAWIARMDVDDIMLPGRLAQQLAMARANPDVDLFGARVRLFRDDGAPTEGQRDFIRWSNGLLCDAAIKRNLFRDSPIMHPTFFARKSFFQAMGGYRDHPWAEDYDFLFHAAERGAVFAKSPRVLLAKRDGDDRLYRRDERCKRPALMRAKVHYLCRGPWPRGGRPLWVAGRGGTAKSAAKALLGENARLNGFLDGRDGQTSTSLWGLPVLPLRSALKRRALETPTRAFVVLCIGQRTAADMVEAELKRADWLPGKDYLRCV